MPSTNANKIEDSEKQPLALKSSTLHTTPSQPNKDLPSRDLEGQPVSKMSKIQHIFLCCVILLIFTFTVSSAAANGAIKAVTLEERLRFQELLDSVEPAALHDVLHRHMKDQYQHGVYQEDKTAMEVVHQTRPEVAQSLVELAKRQSNNSTASTSPTSSTVVVVPDTSTTSQVPVTPSTTPVDPTPTPSATPTQQQTSQPPPTTVVQPTPSTAVTTSPSTTAVVVPPTTTPTTRASTTPATTPTTSQRTSTTNGELPQDIHACPSIPFLPASTALSLESIPASITSLPESPPVVVTTNVASIAGSAAPSAQPFYSPVLVSSQNPSIGVPSGDSAASSHALPTNVISALRSMTTSASNSVNFPLSPPYKNSTYSISLPPYPVPSNSSFSNNSTIPASDFNATSGSPSLSDSQGASLPSSDLPSSSIVFSPSSSVVPSSSRGASSASVSSTTRQTSSVVDSSNRSTAPQSTTSRTSTTTAPTTSRSVTQQIVYTTTLANGAPTTVTSITVVPADQAENTGSATKTNPNASLQTNGGNARNQLGLTGLLGAIGVVVVGAL